MTDAVRITLITALLTTFLALIKLAAGHYGDSHALFADGLHSFSDVLIDILVIFAAHYGAKQADSDHPYGHGRIETAATLGLALILVITGIAIILDAGKHLWGGQPTPLPHAYALWIALFSILLNECIFRYTLRMAKKINSQLLEANAWHSRSDVAVSLVVLLGIAGALLGLKWLDAAGAVFVGIMICKMSGTLVWKSISELIDTGVEKETLNIIRKTITEVPGVKTLHQLRTRTLNHIIFVDVHILVSPRISVSEGHFVGEQVMAALKKLPAIADVIVHVDPEDDEIVHASTHLPGREDIVALIKSHCSHLPFPEKILLHYLKGKIEIEMRLPHNAYEEEITEKAYQEALKDQHFIRKITVIFS